MLSHATSAAVRGAVRPWTYKYALLWHLEPAHPARNRHALRNDERCCQRPALGRHSRHNSGCAHLAILGPCAPQCSTHWTAWHYGQAIKDVLAANPRLGIEYFPVAAPDLNPQEQVWKATRQAISHNHVLPRLPELAANFETHLTTNSFPSSFLQRYGYDTLCPMFN